MIEYGAQGEANGHEGHCNGIPFETDIVNDAGCSVTFFPTKGRHSRKDVGRARHELANNRDVVCVYVEWQERVDPEPEYHGYFTVGSSAKKQRRFTKALLVKLDDGVQMDFLGEQNLTVVLDAECKQMLKELLEQPEEFECASCLGYGHFDANGKPTTDRRDRKCLDCTGTGKVFIKNTGS